MSDLVSDINAQLRITEVFCSLQGETASVGRPTVFVRLTGCPLRCSYCDTAYAFKGGYDASIASILEEVKALGCSYVTVTGGEPLAQRRCSILLDHLVDAGYCVSLETSGALSVAVVNPGVRIILDIKTPSSNEASRNDWGNLSYLKRSIDEIKFVVGSRSDYDWAKQMIDKYQLFSICDILVSPVYDQLNPTQLAEWVVDDRLPVRFQIQLHKVLWGEQSGK